jgi:hypothetical protein
MQLERSRAIPLLDPLLRWLLPAIATFGILLARFFPFHAVPPLCPLRRITGIPCIGCGATRSWVHMAHGRIGDAFLQSPLGALLFVAALSMVLYIVGRSLDLLPALRLHTSPTEALALRGAVVGLLAAHWLYLVLSGVAA